LESRLVFQVRRIGGKGKFDFTLYLENEKIKIQVKKLIFHEIEIVKKILGADNLQENDQIIIRFIDDDVQDYFKQLYKCFNYGLIFDKFMNVYISNEKIIIPIYCTAACFGH